MLSFLLIYLLIIMARHKGKPQGQPEVLDTMPEHLRGVRQVSYADAKERYLGLAAKFDHKKGGQDGLRRAIRAAKALVREALESEGRSGDAMYVNANFWRHVERAGFAAAEQEIFKANQKVDDLRSEVSDQALEVK